MEMEEMPREVVMREPEFKVMFERLRGVSLDELVWQTLGGVPASIVKLSNQLTFAPDDAIKPVVEKVVRNDLEKAIGFVMRCSIDVTTKLLPLFAERDHVSKSTVKELGISLSSSESGPYEVLRSVDSKNALVAASPKVAFVLCHRLYQKGMFEKMQSFDFLRDVANNTTRTP